MADELDMDILALDDLIWGGGEFLAFWKIGNFFIVIDNEDYPDFVKNPLNLTDKEWKKFDGFVSVSSLGMWFRNKQWASYINAVKTFYDIIIVYAGNGHTDSDLNTWKDVPELVGEEHIIFNFYAAQKESPLQQEFIDTAHKLLDNSHSEFRDVSAYIKKPELTKSYPSNLWRIKTRGDDWCWNGKEFWYMKSTKAETDKYIESLPAQTQYTYRKAQEAIWNKKTEKLELIKFDVFLPQWSYELQDL